MNKVIPLSLLGVLLIMMTPLQTSGGEFQRQTINAQSVIKIEAYTEENAQKNENTVQNSYTTRMTSYYTGESGSGDCTGSGLCTWDFEVNEHGWYTYQGKLVVATATPYLLKYGFSLADGVHTYRYGDDITLNIAGVDYEAIVLDSCGSSMKNGRIDLFVSNANSVKDTMIEVR